MPVRILPVAFAINLKLIKKDRMKLRLLHLDWRVVYAGSNANNSGKAGVFSLNANNTWSNNKKIKDAIN